MADFSAPAAPTRQSAAWFRAECLLVLLTAPVLLVPTFNSYLTVAALSALVLFWSVQIARRSPWPRTPYNGALLVVVVMIALATLITISPPLTLPKLTGLILGLAVFRAVAQARGKKRQTLASMGLLLAGAGVWGLGVLSLDWPSKVPLLQDWLQRLPRGLASLPGSPGGGVSPNQLAGVLVLLLPVSLSAVLGHRSFGRWPATSLFAVLAGAAFVSWGVTLFFTQSRGGWMGGIVGLLIFVALWGLSGKRRWQRVMGIGVPVAAALAGVLLLVLIGMTDIGRLLYGNGDASVATAVGAISFQGRMEIWSRAVRTILDFPFTGRGLGTFRQVTPLLYPLFLVPPGKDIAHAHNVFLQVGVDFGLPGLVGYVALLLVAATIGWRKVRAGGASRWLGLGLLSGLVGFHVYGLADTLAPGSKPAFLLWWVLALLAVDPDGGT